MGVRPEAKKGQYNVVCTVCGVAFKSNLITLDAYTNLPICVFDSLNTNLDPGRPKVIAQAKVPNATGEPEDTFITYDTP